jgi:hypothetical protein
MYIKDACRSRALIIARLSKEECISLSPKGRHFVLHVNMTETGGAPST